MRSRRSPSSWWRRGAAPPRPEVDDDARAEEEEEAAASRLKEASSDANSLIIEERMRCRYVRCEAMGHGRVDQVTKWTLDVNGFELPHS